MTKGKGTGSNPNSRNFVGGLIINKPRQQRSGDPAMMPAERVALPPPTGVTYDAERVGASALSILLAEIRQYPLLSGAEELALARQIRSGTPQQRAAARERMLHCNLRLVVAVATSFLRSRNGKAIGLELGDLVQEGSIGLLRAIERFDPEGHSNGKFSTYAIWWIRQAISRAIHRDGGMIRLPEHVAVRRERIGRAKQQLINHDGIVNPSLDEIMAALDALGDTGATREQVREIERAGAVLSLDKPIEWSRSHGGKRFGEVLLGELIADHGAVPVADQAAHCVDGERLLARMRSVLSEREMAVLCLRYGLAEHDQREHTLTEAGCALGNISRERVRQIEAKALRKLRECFDRDELRELLSAPDPADLDAADGDADLSAAAS